MNKESGLDRWFKEKWVDISRKDKSGKYAPCGRSDSDKGKYPKCRPSKRVNKSTPVTTKELTDKEEKAAIRKKRKAEKEKRSESAGGSARKPKRAPTIKKSNRTILLSNFVKLANSTAITSFDFDETIRKLNGDINKSILPEVQAAASNGIVYLVTSRSDTKENVDFVIQYLKENAFAGRSLFSYFNNFYFVGGIKANKLKELGVTTHYDDSDVELEQAKELGISGIKV